MQPTNKQICREFSSGNFKFSYDYLSDDIQWNIVGDKILSGKDNVIEFCNKTAEYISGVITKFNIINLIEEDNCIAIDGTAEFINKENVTTNVSSCDLYNFKNNKIQSITSYCIAVNE